MSLFLINQHLSHVVIQKVQPLLQGVVGHYKTWTQSDFPSIISACSNTCIFNLQYVYF